MSKLVTPFDSPHTLWERLTFPMLAAAWADGYTQSIRDSRDSIQK